MSEATAVLDSVTISTPGTPDSTAAPAQEPIVPDGGGTGNETPGAGAAPAAAPARDASTYALDELDGLYREGKLTDPKLVTQRDNLQRADYDRRTNEARYIAAMDAEETARLEGLGKLATDTRARVADAINSEHESASRDNRLPSLALISERVDRALSDYEAQSAAVHLAPAERPLRQALLLPVEQGGYGDTVTNRRAVAAMGLAELTRALILKAYENGQRSPADGDHVVMTKAELAAVKKAAVDEFKAANPGAAPPAGTQRNTTAAGRAVDPDRMDMAEIDKRLAAVGL